MQPRRLIVVGPTLAVILIVALLATAGVLAIEGLHYEAGLIIVGVMSKILPIARGRGVNPALGRYKEDKIKIVRRMPRPPTNTIGG